MATAIIVLACRPQVKVVSLDPRMQLNGTNRELSEHRIYLDKKELSEILANTLFSLFIPHMYWGTIMYINFYNQLRVNSLIKHLHLTRNEQYPLDVTVMKIAYVTVKITILLINIVFLFAFSILFLLPNNVV